MLAGPFTYRYRYPGETLWRSHTVQHAESIVDADMQFWEAVGPSAILVSPLYEIAKMAIFPTLILLPVYYAWDWIAPLFT